MKIEIFSRRNFVGLKRWHFRVRAGNGEIIAQSEAYNQRGSALGTAHALKTCAANAEIIEDA
jgi:uncharacterized protein YegP (UPF0339 family)